MIIVRRQLTSHQLDFAEAMVAEIAHTSTDAMLMDNCTWFQFSANRNVELRKDFDMAQETGMVVSMDPMITVPSG